MFIIVDLCLHWLRLLAIQNARRAGTTIWNSSEWYRNQFNRLCSLYHLHAPTRLHKKLANIFFTFIFVVVDVFVWIQLLPRKSRCPCRVACFFLVLLTRTIEKKPNAPNRSDILFLIWWSSQAICILVCSVDIIIRRGRCLLPLLLAFLLHHFKINKTNNFHFYPRGKKECRRN